jgi:serine protease AprX
MQLNRFPRTSLAAVVFSLVALPVAAAPGHQKVDRALRHLVDAGGAGTQHVIITVNPGCHAAVRDALVRHGDAIGSEQVIIDAVSGDVHTADVDELAKSPCVKAVASDAPVVASGASSAASSGAGQTIVDPAPVLTSTLRDTLGLPHFAALDSSVPTGAGGVTVAVIDSGIEPNGDFGTRIVGFWDFTKKGRAVAAYDDYGHGTHIAGLIGSSGKLSNYEFQGVAPDVRLIGLKVLDKTGAGKTSDVINAIEFVIANRAALNVQVINLSLGHPIFAPAADDPLVQAVEQASAAGIIVVASAGNNGQKSDGTAGYAGITSPGNAPSAITVGAANTHDSVTRFDDEVAIYSSRGPTWFDAFAKPDVVAPGHHLTSDTSLTSYLYGQLPSNHGKSKNGQPLLTLSGSSMAAAVTSGVVALVLQAHNQNPYRYQRALTPNLVKGVLEYSAIPIASADALTQGAGEINAAGAITLATGIDTSRPLGAVWLRRVTPVSVIGGASYFWGRHIIYGPILRTGDLLTSNNIVWSSNIVWGTATEQDNIVWGTATESDNIVWGTSAEQDNIVWGTNIVWSTRVIGQQVGPSNIVWGSNIVWSTMESDNIVWGTMTESDNIVWGTSAEGDNIVWGTGGGL